MTTDLQKTACHGVTSTADTRERRIRSFVRRAGRITVAQERALQHEWARYGIDLPDILRDDSPGKSILDLQTIFGRSAPKTLEIGFGNGDTLLSVAQQQPHADFIGIEVHRSGAGHLLNAAARQDLSNLKVICHDAVEVLQHYLAEQSLDEVWILFPDPWHKARHNKRRLVQGPFVDMLASRMRTGAFVYLATDWQPYAEQMLGVLSHHPHLRNLAPTDDGFIPRPAWRPLTRFERRGQRLGHGVWDLCFEKLAD